MMVGVLVLIGLAIWAVITATNRAHGGLNGPTRQVLDEQFARGVITTDDNNRGLHTPRIVNVRTPRRRPGAGRMRHEVLGETKE